MHQTALCQAAGKWPLEERAQVMEFIQAAPLEAKVRAGEMLSDSATSHPNWGITWAVASLLPEEKVTLLKDINEMFQKVEVAEDGEELNLDFVTGPEKGDIMLKQLAQKLSPKLRVVQIALACNDDKFTDAGLSERVGPEALSEAGLTAAQVRVEQELHRFWAKRAGEAHL